MTCIPFPLVVSGTAYERGLEHGRALREFIHESIRRWKNSLPHEYGCEANVVIRRFLDATNFKPAIEAWTPDFLDEVRGLAEGAGIDPETMYVFQLLDEMWNNADAILGEHCTSLGMSPKGRRPALLAQTIDVEAFRDGHQLVLHSKGPSDGMETFAVASAGSTGFNGLNSRGVGLCCNGMLQVSNSSTGLPVACVVRGVLQQPTVEDAVAFLRKVPHASGQNYMVGDATGVTTLECSANDVVEIEPDEHAGRLLHTNHPLRTDDLQPWYREALKANDLHPFVINSRTRLAEAERQLKAMDRVTVRNIKRLLSSTEDPIHPICGTGQPGELYTEYRMMTFAATVMELSAVPRLHVALGPPSHNPYRTLRFASRSNAQP